MMNLQRVLVVGKESEIQKLAQPLAERLYAADDISDALNMIDSAGPELVLFDSGVPRDNIENFLEAAEQKSINTPVVIFGDENETELADRFKRLGASDYIKGRSDYHRLSQIICRIKNKQPDITTDTDEFFSDCCPEPVSIVGRSKSIKKTLKLMHLVSRSSCNPILILGETGTGKELAAKAIHILRHGNTEKFVAVNCAALTSNLLESELFGHVKGAFTGADTEKTGLLELAGTGTIFLDEVSEMPMELQAKLLRVLQEKTFRKVGGLHDILCKATIITSSNRDLQKELRNHRFRHDLYYRLTVCPIVIEPLRAEGRKEDIPLLAEYFIKTSTICPEKKGKTIGLTKLALEALQKHNWPGNVRELRNVIERAILLETTCKIGLSSLIINPDFNTETASDSSKSFFRDFSLEKAERELIARALQEAGWQKTRAAALLGITRATLYAKVKQYNIEQSSKSIPAMST